jgi:hypothetical protein
MAHVARFQKQAALRGSRITIACLLVALTGAYVQFGTVSAGATDAAINGADGTGPGANGTTGDYTEPGCGDYYRLYIGELGETVDGSVYYNAPTAGSTENDSTYVGQAYNNYENGRGFGAGVYWWMQGLAMSGLSETASNATWWGGEQAANALSYLADAQTATGNEYTSTFVFADVESNQNWETGASGQPYNADVLAGFISEMQLEGQNVGVYSGNVKFPDIMGSGTTISQAEWTNEDTEGTYSGCPTGVFTGGPSPADYAIFFGGQTKTDNTALMWQWVLGGADYDQADYTHFEAMF